MRGVEPSSEDRGVPCCVTPAHDRNMTAGSSGPTCYRITRSAANYSPNGRLAFAGSAAHHSVVLLCLGVLV
jgi:hypothetical protein